MSDNNQNDSYNIKNMTSEVFDMEEVMKSEIELCVRLLLHVQTTMKLCSINTPKTIDDFQQLIDESLMEFISADIFEGTKIAAIQQTANTLMSVKNKE